jgi:hypothetical protein
MVALKVSFISKIKLGAIPETKKNRHRLNDTNNCINFVALPIEVGIVPLI